MKQTNSALKFLLAHYRAIFKQAYFKGLVSAAVLTAGMAAGANANAADVVLDATAFTSLAKDTTISNVETPDDGNYNDINIEVDGEVTNTAEEPILVTISGFSGADSTKKTIVAGGEAAAGILNAANVNWKITSANDGITIADANAKSLTVHTGDIEVNAASNAATLTISSVESGLGTTVNVKDFHLYGHPYV